MKPRGRSPPPAGRPGQASSCRLCSGCGDAGEATSTSETPGDFVILTARENLGLPPVNHLAVLLATADMDFNSTMLQASRLPVLMPARPGGMRRLISLFRHDRLVRTLRVAIRAQAAPQAAPRPPHALRQVSTAADGFFVDDGVTFASMGLSPAVCAALEAAGYSRPAHVQVPPAASPTMPLLLWPSRLSCAHCAVVMCCRLCWRCPCRSWRAARSCRSSSRWCWQPRRAAARRWPTWLPS